MSEVSTEELSKILEQDAQWMTEHYDELVEKYPGQIIAIDRGEIIAIGESEVEKYCYKRSDNNPVNPLILMIPHPDELIPFLI